MEKLNSIFQEASQAMYGQQAGGPNPGAGAQQGPPHSDSASNSSKDDDVQDANFEEVK